MDAGDWDRKIQYLAAQEAFLNLSSFYPEYFKDICLFIPRIRK